MKKFISISLLLSVLFLYGCSTKNNWLTADQLIAKQQECASYKDAIQKQVDEHPIRRTNQLESYTSSLKEIFYSPVKNSCLYSTYYVLTKKSDATYTCGTYVIQDWANNGTVGIYVEAEESASNKTFTCLWAKTDAVYNKAVKELKWE